jgi:hypothetical protein
VAPALAASDRPNLARPMTLPLLASSEQQVAAVKEVSTRTVLSHLLEQPHRSAV